MVAEVAGDPLDRDVRLADEQRARLAGRLRGGAQRADDVEHLGTILVPQAQLVALPLRQPRHEHAGRRRIVA
jgi:hypothetical protein